MVEQDTLGRSTALQVSGVGEAGSGHPGSIADHGTARTGVLDRRREPQMIEQGGRIALLDGLRLFAALAVLLFHYVSRVPYYWGASESSLSGLRAVTDYGWLGVDLFFMISGFVICGSGWSRQVGEFAVSRIVRLYPAYLLAVVLTAIALIALDGPLLPVPQILANLTMFQALLGVPNLDGSYWTLSREMLFYLCFALVVWRGLTYRRVVLFSVLWLLASLVGASTPESPIALFANLQSTPYFVAGITMYLMYRFRPTLLLYSLLGMTFLFAQYGLSRQVVDYAEGMKRQLSWPTAAFVVTAFFLLMLAISVGGLGRVRSRWLVWAGGLTYPLYLIHQEVGITIIARLSPAVPAYAVLTLVAVGMLGAAFLIHTLVEKPLTPLLKRGLAKGLAQMRGDNSTWAGRR